MKFTSKVIVDNRITIPIEIVRKGQLKKGDLVDVDIKKVDLKESK